MLLKRRFLLSATLLFFGMSVIDLSGKGYAAEQSRVRSGQPSASIKGSWYSAKETLAFNANGTIIYKGKRYYYAVSSGGTIQLTGKRGSLTIPYQLAGGKLTLTVDGKATVYTRKR
ncbi:MAG: hypothetical protein HY935_00605 [Nitrosomonadales bacterium]|nr:hypothetical protein [Nitrosomonadales bacterium]